MQTEGMQGIQEVAEEANRIYRGITGVLGSGDEGSVESGTRKPDSPDIELPGTGEGSSEDVRAPEESKPKEEVPSTIVAYIGIAVAENGKWQATGWSGETGESNAEIALTMLRDQLDYEGDRYAEIHTFTHRVEIPVPKVGQLLLKCGDVSIQDDTADLSNRICELAMTERDAEKLDRLIAEQEYDLSAMKRLRDFAIAEQEHVAAAVEAIESVGQRKRLESRPKPERSITVTDTVTASRSVVVKQGSQDGKPEAKQSRRGRPPLATSRRKQPDEVAPIVPMNLAAVADDRAERLAIRESESDQVAETARLKAFASEGTGRADLTELERRVEDRLKQEIKEYIAGCERGTDVSGIARYTQVERARLNELLPTIEGIEYRRQVGMWFAIAE